MNRERMKILTVMTLFLFILFGAKQETMAAEETQFVGVEGSYATDIRAAINLVNQYRQEACLKGYPNPENPSEKLTKDDYVPIKWSRDLEYIARIRAAESSIYGSHERPNGMGCFSLTAPNGVSSYAEVLAWAGTTIVDSVKMWYSEKSTWVNSGNGVTGHYTSMINPNTTYMGMASFNGAGAGEFTNEEWVNPGYYSTTIVMDTTPLEQAKNVIQTVEVAKKDLSSLKPFMNSKLTYGEKARISLAYKYRNSKDVLYLGKVTWNCNAAKLKLQSDGTMIPYTFSKEKVTFTYSGDVSGTVEKTISVLPQTPKLKKVKVKSKSAKVYFEKVQNVTGYQVRYQRYKNWKVKKVTVTVSKKVSQKTIKNLTGKSYYSFMVRSYKKVGKKTYYSNWSNIVGMNTK